MDAKWAQGHSLLCRETVPEKPIYHGNPSGFQNLLASLLTSWVPLSDSGAVYPAWIQPPG